MVDAKSDGHLIVVGSSAGGIEALSMLVSTLPADFAAPVVIAQHLDPSRPSHLGDILGHRAKLPVKTVNSRERMKPGVIYVVPAHHHARITGTMVEAQPARSDGRPMPSVDQLLTSAAEAYGEQVIAVILSGTGSDGAAGAYMVKRAGGTVVIQDPDTATYPGMPLSLAPTTVDVIAPLDRVGPILHDLLSGIVVPTRPGAQRTLESFLDELRERNGIDFNSYKTPTIMRRLQRRIVATESGNLAGYRQYLQTHPAEYQQLINAFLIKVTEFFRDPEFYTYLRETILPEMIAYARKHGNELRIWSAGCATGEEAYSLAILVSEVLGTSLEQFNIRIFATDADSEAIAFARRGNYPVSALGRLPEEMVSRYFAQNDGSYQIKKPARALVVFGHNDLGQRAPFPHTDLVVCRNVLIYFTPDLQQRTLKLFAYSLREGGYLALGKAETTGQMSEFFAPRDKARKVYERHGERVLPPPTRGSLSIPLPPARPAFGQRPPTSAVIPTEQKEIQRVRLNSETLLLNLPVGVVVVDRRYDIQTINAAARSLLAIFGQAVGEDLIHLARSAPSEPLRAAIDQAFAQGTQTCVEEFI
ncbi:MAG TPA: CheR family methyltransferase, partial [Ktedonobacterales bacterium]